MSATAENKKSRDKKRLIQGINKVLSSHFDQGPNDSQERLTRGKLLYNKLTRLFITDPEIDEFGLVPKCDMLHYFGVEPAPDSDDEADSKHPELDSAAKAKAKELGQPFMLMEHKLAAAYWVIPIILYYCLYRFRSLRTELQTHLNSDILTNASALTREAVQLTRVMVLFNPGHMHAIYCLCFFILTLSLELSLSVALALDVC